MSTQLPKTRVIFYVLYCIIFVIFIEVLWSFHGLFSQESLATAIKGASNGGGAPSTNTQKVQPSPPPMVDATVVNANQGIQGQRLDHVMSSSVSGNGNFPRTSFTISTSFSGRKKEKVAYAITVTKDGHFVDGALVLGYAARKAHLQSKYGVDLIAFVAPTVITARSILSANGWKVLEKGLPVALDEIENQNYAQKMKNSGCCGADEFLKLWAFTLTDYHRVIHLDMDSIIFQNMDELFDLDKEMLFTGDYNMKGRSPVVPAQGGFLVVRPSMDTFHEFQAIIRKGDHTGKGWEGSRIGNFWGGQTIQGIVPFFYHVKHPERGEEVNRCLYNCMVDNPYRPKTNICLDGHETCEDCRLQKPENVKSAHFTICQKPWTCTLHTNPKNNVLCEALHVKWFALRDELEKESNVDLSYRKQNSRFKKSLGMCKGYGDDKYIPIPLKENKEIG